MYIAGEWVESGSGRRFEAVSPATGACIGSVPEGTREDARRAITAANAAWEAWAACTPFERARAMHRVADVIVARRDELARVLTLDQGKPLHAEAYPEVDDTAEYFRIAAEDAKRWEGLHPASVDPNKRVLVQRVPRGVVGVITPWNWPYGMPAEILAPALAAGNAVVWVPAPSTSVCAVHLTQCVVEAGLPPGVFNLVTGPGPVVGDEVAGSPGTHAVGFIGSIETGHRVAARAAGKELLLELGGNGPLVILDDANLDRAVSATIKACFLCAGQSCSAGELVLVQEGIRQAFLDRLVSAVSREVRLGDPFDSATTMGPLNNEPTAAKMDRHVADAIAAKALVLAGGQRAKGFPTDLYYEPTVLDGVRREMQVAREETFGPIVPVCAVRDDEEALEIANAAPYGLVAAVFTADLRRGLRFAERIHAGWVNVNETTNWWELHLPFGGGARSRSGVGRVGGRFPLERLTELKTIVVDLG
jgi:acyl-CoA reductase-like NAD-dependent aldehyde dehydrogenase